MIEIYGPPSHSPFRLKQLLTSLQKLDSNITSLGARYIHFLEASETLNKNEQQTLDVLLSYGPDWKVGPSDGQKIIVIPIGRNETVIRRQKIPSQKPLTAMH